MAERNALLTKGNPLKLGLFGSNCSSGRSYITIPERWVASWENNLALARMAEQVGLEAMVPIARWKGYGGETNPNGSSFETITWATGLLALTERINVFATVHIPLIHPVFAAKQLATADQVGQGRLGINLVCGWSEDEFGMFGVTKHQHDAAYEQADEWWEIARRVWSGEKPFDYAGSYYQLLQAEGAPRPCTGQAPMMMNAGMSMAGRQFAIRSSDMHFDSVGTRESTIARTQETKQLALERGRTIQVWTPVAIVCRPTQQEATDFVQYCADHLDWEAIGPVETRTVQATADATGSAGPRYTPGQLALGRGAYCIVGNPDHVAAELAELHDRGLDGAVINFVDYLAELPYFAQEVLPRLEQRGLREKVGAGYAPVRGRS